MNVTQAIEQAQALVVPEFLFGMGTDAVLDERNRNESAIKILVTEWFENDNPSFSFDLVRNLADRNRELCDALVGQPIPDTNSPNLPRSLSEDDTIRSIAALQNRAADAVQKEVSDVRNTALDVVYASHPLGGVVVGVDLETTGRAPDRGRIINVGWEYVKLAEGEMPFGACAAWCGLPAQYEETGVPLTEIHGITWGDIADRPQFRDDSALQASLLQALEAFPYLAHNAAFEDAWLLLNLNGYAEGRKAGRIVPVDTRDICRQLDPEVRYLPHESRPASLESWARRRKTLSADEDERHLGLDDTDLMLRTVLAELAERNLLPKSS
ncbi:3'-5' exonuclease [Cryptobacterium curtum]